MKWRCTFSEFCEGNVSVWTDPFGAIKVRGAIFLDYFPIKSCPQQFYISSILFEFESQ